MSIEILIVDDNSDIRNILNELIIDAGYKTRIAANYNQALSEIDKKMPDVAILDVKLKRRIRKFSNKKLSPLFSLVFFLFFLVFPYSPPRHRACSASGRVDQDRSNKSQSNPNPSP